MPLVSDLPYRADSAALFEALLVDRPWPVFLDSGRPHVRQGRHDILVADPSIRLLTRGGETRIEAAGEVRVSRADPLSLVREMLGPPRPAVPGLPFCGGAVGYFGYDLARRLESLPCRARDEAHDEDGLPEMGIGIYERAILVDHEARSCRLVDWAPARRPAYLDQLDGPCPGGRGGQPLQALGRIEANLSRRGYLAAIEQIQRYLRAGDCYQVNLAQRFAAPVAGDPWVSYRVLRTRSPAPFGAYLDLAGCQILCASPERFLRVRDGSVLTCPIKGTRPRGADAEADRRLAQALRDSAKDRAENLMIVDLLRNDLGKVCAVGSIHVPVLFALESFAQVHHLVSRVGGRLAEGRTALDLLRAAFPGGSVTGAPKRRAMEIIEELEPDRRGVYCGAIGYLGFDGAMDTNIAIRTLVLSAGRARLWAGGGIVADSDPEAEYRETFDKAGALLGLLGGDGSAGPA